MNESNSAIALSQREKIARVQSDREKLLVYWGDGHCSTFHYLWLRDNCYCSVCGDPRRGEKYIRLVDIPVDIEPRSVDWHQGNALEIHWKPNHHKSVYDAGWLRQHCYSARERVHRQHQHILWDRDISANLPQVSSEEVQNGDGGMLQLLKYLRDYGICFVRNLSPEPGQLESFAQLLGPLLETNYGRIFEIIADPKESQKSVANSSRDLLPHTDDAYQDAPPGIIFFHCLMAREEGGGQSIFVDGFRIAEELRLQDAAAFELLCRYEVSFRKYYRDRIDMRSRYPIFSLDSCGHLQSVRINNLFAAPLDLPEAAIAPFYSAYRKLMQLYTDAKFGLQYSLQPGDLVMFDNSRILHGRSAIAKQNQYRHLRYCSVDRDYFRSLYRLLEQKLSDRESVLNRELLDRVL